MAKLYSAHHLTRYRKESIEENELVKVGSGDYIVELLLKCLNTRAA